MNDEQRTPEERIIAAARELYNAPPEAPREEMWAEIEGRLDAADADSDVPTQATVHPLRRSDASASSARSNRRFGWWVGIAAALVIGLGLGRLTLRTPPAEVPIAAESTVESTGETTVAETPGPVISPPVGGVGSNAAARSASDGDAAAREAAAPPPAPTASAPGAAGDRTGRTPGLQYAVATRQLLHRGESFLASVQTDLASGAPDPEMEVWARSLLTRTRVLMASPAASEPETRRLLEDLELMLAQIVVTSATGDPGEARILGEGLEEGNLRYRLRSATEDDSGSGPYRTPDTSSL